MGDHNRSGVQLLKVGPGQPSPAALLRLTTKLEQIQATGALDLDLSWLNNNYQRTLAKYVQRSSAHKLREVEVAHRYAALVCFLWQTHRDTVDHLIDMQDKLVNKVCNKAQKQCDEALRQHQQSLRRSVSMLHTLVEVVLDEEIKDENVREAVFGQIPKETLREQVEDSNEWLTGKHSHLFHGVVRRYEYVRQFFPALLQHLTFEGQTAEAPEILHAVETLHAMNEAGQRSLPENAPMDFIPKTLRPFVAENGSVNKPAWECALLLSLRDEIKSGNIAVTQSKRLGPFERFFIPDPSWQAQREGFFQRAGLPSRPEDVEAYLTQRLNRAYDTFLEDHADNSYATVTEAGWKLSSDPADKLDVEAERRLEQLRGWLDRHMRGIRLPELLIEVDNDVRFTQYFRPPAAQDRRTVEEVCATIATLMAHGCNIGPYTMARLTEGVSYPQIKRLTDWQLTEENQRQALADVVKALSRLETSSVWGEGKTSSSDGQRFPYPRRVLQQTYSHKIDMVFPVAKPMGKSVLD